MSRDVLLPTGRVLYCVPSGAEKAASRELKARLDAVVPSWSLDYCHVRGRGLAAAERLIQPGWRYLDIKAAFPSVYQPRLWLELHKLGGQGLEQDTRLFFERLSCQSGLPEGCPSSFPLFNIYLAALDRRWAGRMVRYADNIATANTSRLRKELLDIGLGANWRPSFTGNPNKTAQGGGPEEHQ